MTLRSAPRTIPPWRRQMFTELEQQIELEAARQRALAQPIGTGEAPQPKQETQHGKEPIRTPRHP